VLSVPTQPLTLSEQRAFPTDAAAPEGDGRRAATKRQARRVQRFDGKYLSLTSFRRDGAGVATPVWFVANNGRLLVETDADSYKVKRIRRDPHVRIALCSARGRVRGDAVDALAEILPGTERERVEQLLARKYRIDRLTVYPVYRLVRRLRGRASRMQKPPVTIAITPRSDVESKAATR